MNISMVILRIKKLILEIPDTFVMVTTGANYYVFVFLHGALDYCNKRDLNDFQIML